MTDSSISSPLKRLYFGYIREISRDWHEKHPGKKPPVKKFDKDAKNLMLNQHGLKYFNRVWWHVVDKDKFFVMMMSMEI